ncbi:hypothetical protein CBL_00351 [Carabus blaptoides fortunei]
MDNKSQSLVQVDNEFIEPDSEDEIEYVSESEHNTDAEQKIMNDEEKNVKEHTNEELTIDEDNTMQFPRSVRQGRKIFLLLEGSDAGVVNNENSGRGRCKSQRSRLANNGRSVNQEVVDTHGRRHKCWPNVFRRISRIQPNTTYFKKLETKLRENGAFNVPKKRKCAAERFGVNVWVEILDKKVIYHIFEENSTSPVYLNFLQNELEDLLEELP